MLFLKSESSYEASSLKTFPFCHATDVLEGISMAVGNMASGFPFEVEGIRFHNSEAAYIAGAFSEASDIHVNVQSQLIVETNGFMAKKRIRRANEDAKRADWNDFNVMWMLYVVWCKCIGNEDFRTLLKSIPSEAVIIEDSTHQHGPTASFWGAKNSVHRSLHVALNRQFRSESMSKCRRKALLNDHRLNQWRDKGVYIGSNVMGKILMLCRDALLEGGVPPIDFALLRSKDIHLLGKPLAFDLPSTSINLEGRA